MLRIIEYIHPNNDINTIINKIITEINGPIIIVALSEKFLFKNLK